MRVRTVLAVCFLFVAALAFAQEWQEKKVEVPLDKDGVQRVEITAGSYYFDPNTIVVKVNVPVELVIKMVNGSHNFVLRAPEAGIDITRTLSKEPVSIRFTPTKAGKLKFFCSHKIPFSKTHEERGMYGFIEVKE